MGSRFLKLNYEKKKFEMTSLTTRRRSVYHRWYAYRQLKNIAVTLQ
jgi:hypothetical protein